MVNKRRFIGATIVVLAAVALAGGLIASNMGFKLNKALIPAGLAVSGVGEVAPFTSLNGTNGIALPDNRQAGLAQASSLRTDIGASAISVTQYVRSTGAENTYAGARGNIDFPLEEGVCYKVRVSGTANTNYIIVGSDDPSFPTPLLAALGGVSLNGTNWYSYNYHQVAATASALRTEIGPNCISVAKFTLSNNGQSTYAGARGNVDFPLIPGECYVVRVSADTSFTPNHY